MTTPTVFVIDRDAESRRAVASVAESAGMAILAFASSREFFAAFDPDRPGCVVCDAPSDEEACLGMIARLRAAGSEIPVLVTAERGDVPTAVRAVKSGAIDVLEKPVRRSELLERLRLAVRQDAADRAASSDRAEVLRRYHTLSERERAVFASVVAGLSNREIAERLGASQKTIEVHRGSVMRKMEADHFARLVRMSALLPGGHEVPPPAAG